MRRLDAIAIVGGLACLCAAAWMVALPAGIAVLGISLIAAAVYDGSDR